MKINGTSVVVGEGVTGVILITGSVVAEPSHFL
jgi:hypothetical protein